MGRFRSGWYLDWPDPQLRRPVGTVMSFRRLFVVTVAGILGGGTGLFAGGLIGAMTCDWNVKEAGCVESGAYGATIGGTILMPLGVYLIGWHRDRLPLFLLTLLSVAGIAAAGLAVAFTTGMSGVIIAVPIVEFVICVAGRWTASGPVNQATGIC